MEDKITHEFLISSGFIKEGLGYFFVLAHYGSYKRYLVYHDNGNVLVMEKKIPLVTNC